MFPVTFSVMLATMWCGRMMMENGEEAHSKSDASSCCFNCGSLPGTPSSSSLTYTPHFSTMSPWFRFSPSDEHLVGHFLLGKILGRICSSEYEQCGVGHCDLYGKEEPWEIWERFRGSSSNHLTVSAHEEEEKDLYLFTELKKVTVKGRKIDRRVGKGDGNWHGNNVGVQIVIRTDEFSLGEAFVGLEGRRKQFSYRGSNCSNGFRWIMHELNLSWPKEAARIGSNTNGMVVLCRIRRNKKKVSPSYGASTEAISPSSTSLPSRKRKAEDDERVNDLESSSQATTTLPGPIPKRVRRENEEIQEVAQAGAVVLLDTPTIGIPTMDPPLNSSSNNNNLDGVELVDPIEQEQIAPITLDGDVDNDGVEMVDPIVQEQVIPLILDGGSDNDEDVMYWRDILGLDMDSESWDFNWEDYDIVGINDRMNELPLWHEMTIAPSSAVELQC